MINKRNPQAGFSLLEVLIAITIFAIGMLALASLQGNLTRSAADANMRTVAANIAEELIENRRGFARLTDPTNTFPAFDDIVDETDTISRGGITYELDSTVEDYWYQLDSDSFTMDPPTGSVYPDYKLMAVTVSWTGPNFRSVEGTELTGSSIGTGSITITDTISSLTSAASQKVTSQDASGLGIPPLPYTPGAQPDVAVLSLGDDRFRESRLPQPDVLRQGERVQTRFDVITYSQVNGEALIVRREDFAAVSCECTLQAPPGDPESAGRRPTIWAGDEYTLGHFVDKPYGVTAATQQPAFCDICCRDHHDGGTSADDSGDTASNLYDPFRSSSEYVASGTFSGDHKHYKLVGNGSSPATLELADSDGDTYLEACKLTRKDGFFKVAQDFRQEDLNLFPEDFLDEPSEGSTYSGYVTQAADAFEDSATGSYESAPPCIGGPAPCVAEPSFGGDWPLPPAAGQFPSWTSLPLNGAETQQLSSRGIYIDYLSDDLRSVIDCLRGGGDAESCQAGEVILDQSQSVNILEVLPFFDVQLTFLNRWTETPTNTPVDTTNEPLASDNAHSRGVASRDLFGGSTVLAAGHRGNLGLTDSAAVDPGFAANITEGNLIVQSLDGLGDGGGVPVPSPDPEISGLLSETIDGIGATDIVVVGINGVLCDRTATGFECTVPASASSNGQIRVSGYGKADVVSIVEGVEVIDATFPAYACLTGNTLVRSSEQTSGADAHAIFDAFGDPAPDGAGYDIHIQASPCS
jgi:prepilin-type N-terminal cleavage/methylation domain-containing protein